jgi:hypothetical protein
MGITALVTASILVRPNPKDASLYSAGTLWIASSEMVIIVGSIIIPNKIEAVRMLLPSFKVKVDFTISFNRAIPTRPYTIEGIPANNSMHPFTHNLNLSGKNSETNTALPVAKGRENIRDRSVTIMVPYIMGRAP